MSPDRGHAFVSSAALSPGRPFHPHPAQDGIPSAAYTALCMLFFGVLARGITCGQRRAFPPKDSIRAFFGACFPSTAIFIHILWICGYSFLPLRRSPQKTLSRAKFMQGMQSREAGIRREKSEYIESGPSFHRHVDDKSDVPQFMRSPKGRQIKGLRCFSTVSTDPTPTAEISYIYIYYSCFGKRLHSEKS